MPSTEDHDKRMRELRIKGLMALSLMYKTGARLRVTQVGKRGFHYTVGEEAIPRFQSWCEETQKTNEEFF